MALEKVEVVINGTRTTLKLDPKSEEYKRLKAEGAMDVDTKKRTTASNKARTTSK